MMSEIGGGHCVSVFSFLSDSRMEFTCVCYGGVSWEWRQLLVA